MLSAARSEEERARAEHRLYGYLDGSAASSAADWAGRAREEIADIHRHGKLPILVGGTGLYIRTLLNGIAPVPAIDPEVRREVRECTVEQNRDRLAQLDPEAAQRLRPADTTRIARALEVVLSTGKPLSHWQQQRDGGIGETVDLKPIILLPPRDWLYARCDRRFAEMIEQGAVKEVEALVARRLDPSLPVMRAIGVQEIAAYLAGDQSLVDAIEAGQQATRRYAKRQYTWLAHQPPAEWPRFTDPLLSENMARALELL